VGLIIRKRAVSEFPIQHELDGPKLSVRCLGARGLCVLLRAQRGIVALLLSLFVAPLCAAQTYGNSAPPATNATRSGVGEEEGRIIYDRLYIQKFDVISADDLLRRIPGIQDLLNFGESGQRGYK
jgi:hypothetical protein